MVRVYTFLFIILSHSLFHSTFNKYLEQQMCSWYSTFLVIIWCSDLVEKSTARVVIHIQNIDLHKLSDISVLFHVFADLSGLTLSNSGKEGPKVSCLLLEDFVDVHQSYIICLLSSCRSTLGKGWVWVWLWLRQPAISLKLWKPPADYPASPVKTRSTGDLHQPRSTPPSGGQQFSFNLCFL